MFHKKTKLVNNSWEHLTVLLDKSKDRKRLISHKGNNSSYKYLLEKIRKHLMALGCLHG